MTLKRLMIAIFIVIAVTAAASAWFWQYAFSPEGRAKTTFAELRGDTTGLRVRMLRHGWMPREVIDYWRMKVDRYYNREVFGTKLASLGPKVVPVVLDALNDENDLAREAAIVACGRLGSRDATAPLIQVFQRERLAAIRRCCLASLGEIADPVSLGFLHEVLRNEKERLLRADAADALGRLGDKSAIPWLVESLKDPEWNVVESAVIALTRLRAREAISNVEAVQFHYNLEGKLAAAVFLAVVRDRATRRLSPR